MRGAMNFEDFNYNSVNQHVLINPNELTYKEVKSDEDQSHK